MSLPPSWLRGRWRARAAAPVLLALALPAFAGEPSRAAAAGPVPHFAVYRLSLHRSSHGGEVAAVKGRLEVRSSASCDGWRTEQSLGFRMLTQGGESLEHVARLSGFEERDGASFVFSTDTWEDRELTERISGVVRRGAGGVEVRYALPEPAIETLSPQTLFPGQHLEQVLAAARAGERILMRTVFDGSTADNPYQVSSWIGGARPAAADALPGLAGHTAWPVRLAYFPMDALEPQAQFEMSVLLYDNGVAGDMIYDYGDFAIDVRLVELELAAPPVCP